ncbi:phage protease [Pseudomonas sp. D47]|uniref:phage protease n=1 Tax=Pseudomonas sp. D47 TaxID=3159447 RepID=UPI00387AFD6D
MKTKHTPTAAIAACTFEIQAASAAVQLFPAGAFKARDGRPLEVPSRHWVIDGQIAAKLIARVAARATDVVMDYEHQTLNSTENGQPAPAAAWFKGTSLVWRDGEGLFSTQVDWTDKGGAMVDAKEYRYLSPVFSYDPVTGEVLDLLHVGLTNFPALDGMAPLLAMAAARFHLADPAAPLIEEKHRVNKEALIALLGLASDASEEDIQSALTGLKADAGKTQELTEALAAAKGQAPDPAKFVPLAAFDSLKGEVAALKATQIGSEVDDLVNGGLSDGRLHAVQEDWARELGKTNIAALKGYLDKTPAIAALRGQQTQQHKHTPTTTEELGPEALAVCKALGVAPADYLVTLKGEQQ